MAIRMTMRYGMRISYRVLFSPSLDSACIIAYIAYYFSSAIRENMQNHHGSVYCEFRLCITTTQIGGRKRHRARPIPLRRRRNFFCLQKKYHSGVHTAISRCPGATYHISLARYFTFIRKELLFWISKKHQQKASSFPSE